MKKILPALFFTLLFSTNTFALHGFGVTQHFETELVDGTNANFILFGDSHIDLAVEFLPSSLSEYTQSTLTLNNFFVSGLNIDSYSWDIRTGEGIQSACIISGSACTGDAFFDAIALELRNIDVSWAGGEYRDYGDIDESGDLFFANSVTVIADVYFGGGFATRATLSSVPLPGAFYLFASGLVFLVTFRKKTKL